MNGSWWLRVLIVGLVLPGAWAWWRDRPVAAAAGVLAPAEPRQQPLLDAAPVTRGRWTLTPRARYALEARVLGRERYRFDALAALVPVDLALGWGPMSDGRVLAPLAIEQSARYYTVHWPAAPPLPPAELLRHSANVHVIPADAAIAELLAGLRVGEVVALAGELVDATRDDGAWLHTSLTREDTGAGACEVLLVERAARVSARSTR